MKTVTVKQAMLAGAVLMTAGYAGSASAHWTMGSTVAGTLAGATDKFTLNCPAGTAAVYVDLDYIIAAGNATDPGMLTLTLVKGSTGASMLFDRTPRTLISTPNPSSGRYVNGGAGEYEIYVSRTTRGSATYVFTYSCVSIRNPDYLDALNYFVLGTPSPPLPNPINQ